MLLKNIPKFYLKMFKFPGPDFKGIPCADHPKSLVLASLAPEATLTV